jgi:hypothetical protein
MSDTKVLKYGDFTADFNTLPEASMVAMLRRGFAHFMGSEQASKVTGYFKPENAEEDTLPDTAENREAKKREYQTAAFAALVAGTVGVSTRQPAVDPITKIIRRLALADVKTKLDNAKPKLAWPKKASDVIEFPNGQKMTGEELVTRQVAKKVDEYTKEAKRIAAEQAKKAAAAAKAAEAEGLDDLLA